MKNKTLAFALVSSLAVSSYANAEEFNPHFYVGGEVNWHSPKYEDITSTKVVNGNPTTINSTPKKNKLGGALLMGLKLHENFGIEAGYNFIKKSKVTNTQGDTLSVKLKNFYFDVLGYLPISEEVDFIGSLGMAKLKPSVDLENEIITVPSNPNKSKIKLRAGIGAQYKFDDNLAARLMFRYQKGINDLIKHNISGGLGLTWTFI